MTIFPLLDEMAERGENPFMWRKCAVCGFFHSCTAGPCGSIAACKHRADWGDEVIDQIARGTFNGA